MELAAPSDSAVLRGGLRRRGLRARRGGFVAVSTLVMLGFPFLRAHPRITIHGSRPEQKTSQFDIASDEVRLVNIQ